MMGQQFGATLRRLLAASGAAQGPLGVCVSGGSDSLALLSLARRWGERSVVAVHVNHRVRAEAGGEEQWLRGLLVARGIDCAVARLGWEAGEKQSHESLRRKRYAALGSVAAERGLAALLLAHHADDVRETFLQRVQMASGLSGLAVPIPEVSRVEGVAPPVLRPLLQFGKAELRATLPPDAEALSDPSNSNPKYLRARVRAVLERQRDQGVAADVDAVREMMQREWAALEQSAATLSVANVRESGPATTHAGLAARVALHRHVARLKRSNRVRSALIAHLADWMQRQGTTRAPVSVFCESGVHVTWRKKQQSFS